MKNGNQVHLTVKVTNPDGKCTFRRKWRSHSFLRQYTQHLYVAFSGLDLVTLVKDTTGTLVSLADPANAGNLDRWMHAEPESATVTQNGLIVGSGTTAENSNDFHVATVIGNGSAAGQLVYNTDQSVGAVSGSGSSRNFTVTRTFTNSSAGSVDVKEVALQVVSGETTNPSLKRYFAILRDVLPSTVAVGVGQTLTVTYTITITV